MSARRLIDPNASAGFGTQTSPGIRVRHDAGPWWQRVAIYQIAVKSFQDSDGDGIGDLRGLMRRIAHLEWLGVGAVWLTPIYPSPMRDFGYDVADFCAVDPRYGTLDDFDALLAMLHARGIRLILDFVLNHTSDTHPWFIESRASRSNPKRDWYLWADPAENGGPPNNWLSRFGGSAWTWNETTQQYYYHSFLEQQPDLNWRNPAVRDAMAEVIRFWLRRGVDGLRLDAAAVLGKDALLRDDPPDPQAQAKPPPQRLRHSFTDDRPETMHYLEAFRAVVDEFDERVICGEVQGKTDRIGHFYGNDRPRLHLPLNYALLDTPWDALSLQADIDAYFKAIPDSAWPVWAIGGHDKKRAASKVGQAQYRNLVMLALTLRGTPFFFAGDEIGMERVDIPPDRVDDPFEKLVPGCGLNRDGERTPMRWDDSRHGGFTSGEPWLPLGPDVARRNVEKLQADSRSVSALFRALLSLRKREPVLVEGAHVPLRSRNDVLAFVRATDDAQILVALNLAHEPRRYPFRGKGKLLLSSHLDRTGAACTGDILLRSDEGVIVNLAQ